MPLFENFPYTNYHDLNLDWIIQKVKEAYSPDNPPTFAVLSVNGETGAVVLYKEAVVQLPAVDETTWNIFRKSDGVEQGIQFIKNQPMQRISGVNRYNVYDQGNPPPYPVASVDGQTGSVTTWANSGSANLDLPQEAEGDVWALRRETPSGYLGVQFELTDDDAPTGFFILKPEGQTLQKIKILTEDDIPSSAGVVSINGEAGVVVLYASDIKIDSDDNTTVKEAIENAQELTAIEYNSSLSYSAGDFTTYLGVLYVCTGSTTGSWDPSKWSETTAGAQIKAIKTAQATDEGNISTLQGQMTTANGKIETLETAMPTKAKEAIVAYRETGETASTNYSVGEYLVISGNLYRVKANISSGDQFSSSNTEAVDNIGHEVSALNSNLTNLGTCETIMTVTETSETSKTPSHSLADYRYIIIEARNSNNATFMSQIMPISQVRQHSTNNSPIVLYCYDGATHCQTYIKYINDNSLSVLVTSGFTMVIQGIK